MKLAGEIARTLAALLSGGSEEAAIEELRRIVTAAPAQASLPGMGRVDDTDELRAAAMRLFEHWRKTCNHPSARPDPTRIAKAMARLRDGFSEQELRWAIEGMAGSEFHAGGNEAGKRYDDMELCFRNMRNVERFMEAARGRQAATPRGARDEEREKKRQEARKALREGRTDDHDRIVRELRST